MLVQIQKEPIAELVFGQEGLTTINRGYYVYVTEACNLRCNYCFVDDKQNHNHLFDPLNYPKEAGKPDMVGQVLDYIVDDPEGRSSKYIHFFGGEPLIRAKSIARMCSEIKRRVKEKYPNCTLKFGITTNGTLLTEDNCKMLKEYEIGVQLSLDGSEEGNDVHRQLMGGSQQDGNVGGEAKRAAGAYSLVKVDNYLKYFGSNARMTVTPQNLQYLEKSILELHDRGFKSFSVIPNTDSGEWDGRWIEFERMFERVFNYAMSTPGVTVNFVDHAWKNIFDRKKEGPQHLCQAGRNVIGISIHGDIWPCHDFLGKYQRDPVAVSDLQIGHISKGYTLNTQKFSDLKCDSEVKSGAGHDCKSCHAKSMCERGCPYINYASQGAVKEVNATYCQTTRILTDITLRYMLKHPEKFMVSRLTDVKPTAGSPDDFRAQVAKAVFEKQSPFGRGPDGKALLPGPARYKELGIEPQGKLLNGSGQSTSAGQGTKAVKPVNGPRNAGTNSEAAEWDGERGWPSPIPQGPNGTTMAMVPKPIPDLSPRA